ncbi:hypothetical protein AGRA3207_004972 [Actinomadura graeca]|uniref:Uncharacterized protein n=1 Tax=Actinomadura graeca TaxID=2750812 RepID=A0ABX8QZL5_9ACTN|nr:hypothetical protein [Actinomadura graeca]QXJ23771.1 hypothetical protein AGRA3207_004972 [Actinomadura graeca]
MVTREYVPPFAPPLLDRSRPAVPPPLGGEGHWAGAPSACVVDGVTYLAYRLRRPLGEGRGHDVVIAASHDGERFEPVVSIGKDRLDAESLERPALVRTDEGRWRLYLSCATHRTKHWRIETLEAATLEGLADAEPSVVLPGSPSVGVKDPVILREGGKWHLWASCHPLADPAEADRMVTDYATSPDGLDWTWHGTALGGRPGHWDARGVRVAAVVPHRGHVFAYYDGRATAAENYEERTGLAVGTGFGVLAALGTSPVAESPHRGRGLRYLCAVPVPGRGWRLYYEAARADGAHDIRTEFHPSEEVA